MDNDDLNDDFNIQGITEMTEGIASDSGSISEIFLSVHQHCVNYTLNLLVTVDIKGILTGFGNSGESFTHCYHSAFEKCFAIWNLTSRSPKAETYSRYYRKSLIIILSHSFELNL